MTRAEQRKKISYQSMYTELDDFEKRGVCILIDGRYASPMQVVRAHMVREAGSYMRDYVVNDDGDIEALSFTNINKNNKKR